MDFTKIKLPIAVIGIIVAQAFGIIWYVASLDGTVRNLDESVASMQEQATTIDIAVDYRRFLSRNRVQPPGKW